MNKREFILKLYADLVAHRMAMGWLEVNPSEESLKELLDAATKAAEVAGKVKRPQLLAC